ncbi:MAG: hypothetical protein ACTHK2_04350 [Dokdonella sp.]|uniref:hypothetical protein n=1 Tax=Dokdonella sp. TaxID=2291710 RepID=UPI003F7DCFEE
MRNPNAFIAAVLLGTAAAPASADYLSVGEGCQYTDLQAAIDATHGDVNVLHVHADYHGKPVRISGKTLHVLGGYPSCDAAEPLPFSGDSAQLSTLDGGIDTGTKPVLSIEGRSVVDLRNFLITNGHNRGHDGGGIRFSSSGDYARLETHAVDIAYNVADNGGGIYFHAGASTNELELEGYSLVRNNTAGDSGGGIHMEGDGSVRMLRAQTMIHSNTVENRFGTGGGVALSDGAVAYIGSSGINGYALVFNNHATYGGGLALSTNARAFLYSSVAGEQQGRIAGNVAADGAGVYVGATGAFCMGNAGIDANILSATDVYSYKGVAISSYAPSGVRIASSCGPLPDEVACPVGRPCNTIDANISIDDDTKVLIGVESADSVAIRGNLTRQLIAMRDDLGPLQLSDCEITGNSASQYVIRNPSQQPVTIDSCTIAGNSIGNLPLLNGPGPFAVRHSIAWDAILMVRGAPADYANVSLTDSIAQLQSTQGYAEFRNVRSDDPRFVAPGHDYHLLPYSPAVDASAGGLPIDLDGGTRPFAAVTTSTPFDLGAYEWRRETSIMADGFEIVD